VRTYEKAGKVKRLRNDPAVTIAPCTTRGRVAGPAIEASAVLLDGDEAAVAARALARKYPVLQGLVVPVSHRLSRQRTLHYGVTPVAAGTPAGTW